MSLVRRLFGRGANAQSRRAADQQIAVRGNTDVSLPSDSIDLLRAGLGGNARDALLLQSPDKDDDLSPSQRLHARALVLAAWRRFREARAIYRALTESPNAEHKLQVDAAWCAHLSGCYDEALALVDRAISAAPTSNSARFARAVVQLSRGHAADARDELIRVASRDPQHRDVWLNLAVAERALGHEEAAERASRQAVASGPRSAAAWCLLGRTLMMKGQREEAFASYSRARALEVETGEDVRVTALHVVGLYETGDYEGAIRMCEATLPGEPDATANTAYSLALLTTGEYAAGWDQYEFRWFDEPMRSHRARYERPYWTGQPLQGKTILLRGEQGIGDVVQFARYATPLARLGARVMLHVRAGMGPLASSFHDVAETVETLELPPKFDCYVSLMSVPRILGTTLATVPASVPYLTVPATAVSKWAARLLAEGVRVGLVWAGNPNHPRDASRSVSLDSLAPLWDVQGVQFFSLQKEVRETDAAHFPSERIMRRLGPELDDLTDAAAVIDGLDLLIAVDTSLAHIAGALGKPVWLLVPQLPDFRWLKEREDSPWYPSMRLFRDETGQGWSEVIADVCGMLARVAAGDRTLLAGPVPAPEKSDRSPAGRPVPRVAEMRDGIMQFLPDRDDEARSLARYGEYLVGELDLVAHLLPMDGWALEANCGVGSHALWMGRMLSELGELFLYEDYAPAERILRQNLEANGLLDSVTLPRGQLTRDSSIRARSSGPSHTIDDLQLQRLDLLKIRSPAAEEIIEGASATLWGRRPRVLIAADDPGMRACLTERLRSHGYRVWRVTTPLFRAGNFNEWPDDVFAGRVATSILGLPEEMDGGTYLALLDEIE